MKTYWGSGGIAPRILDHSTKCRWVVSFTPRPLHPQGRSPWCPLDKMLGGPQSGSGHDDKDKNSQPLLGLKPPDHPARSPELYHRVIPAPYLPKTKSISLWSASSISFVKSNLPIWKTMNLELATDVQPVWWCSCLEEANGKSCSFKYYQSQYFLTT
jgi:hypothetical protein